MDWMPLKTPLLSVTDPHAKREELIQYFLNTWAMYEDLFACIKEDKAYYLRPEPLRHPLIFYLGHTATFFINKLILAQCIDRRINERFESLFAIGVDEMSWDDLDSTHYNWPKVSEVRAYRAQVKELILQLLSELPLDNHINDNSFLWAIVMGIEHERIHIETSSVIMRMLPLEYLAPSDRWSSCKTAGPAPQNYLIPVHAKRIVQGRGESKDIYGWDNEFGTKEVDVAHFKASAFLVSNQEYLAFIEDEGYFNLQWWTDEGKQWLNYSKARMPRFWTYHDNQYWQRNLLEEIPLPLNWPVEVNYLEAKAFCNWKSQVEGQHYRLPTEAEWDVLRDKMPKDAPEWDKAPGNINLEYYASSCPVDQFQQSQFYDLIGNVWQWTESAIDSFPGFKVHPWYDDFSTPTFDGRHNLIKGGSWISTGNLATKKARYAFRRHFFQHAGFRYIQSDLPVEPAQHINYYEHDALISQYLEFHFGKTYFDVPNYPATCITQCMSFVKNHPLQKALDLGCAVGRSTFELAKYFDHVDGIDFSARFIQQALHLKEQESLHYTIPTEGDLVEYRDITLMEFDYNTLKDKVHFVQGDACNLKSRFNNYDLIFCGNLIDRLYNPKQFLTTIDKRLTPNGYLVLTSPYTWLEEFTDKKNWIGGIKINGENYRTLEGLKNLLAPKFELVSVLDIPFIIRETERKFQHSVAQMTVWQLK